MSTTADGEYKWILDIIVHFSKFSNIALRSKHAVEVAEKLALWIGYLARHTYYSVIIRGLPVGKNLNINGLNNLNNLM